MLKNTDNFVADVWFLMSGRIAPALCCTNPPPDYLYFKKALQETGKQDGNLDYAIEILRDLLTQVSLDSLVFIQASQLLNVIGWRRKYHPEWFSMHTLVNHFKSGKCGPHVAHALAMLATGSDDELLKLTQKIIERGNPESDDLIIARLVRACVLICRGDIDDGENELNYISID